MPAATTKDALLEITAAEFAKLSGLMDKIGPAFGLKADEEGLTPKDIIGHRAHWIALTLGWYSDGTAGKSPEVPAPGYKWSDLKAYNAKLREAQAGMSWTSACALLQRNHATLMAEIEALGDADLYGGPMPGGRSKWTTGRFFEAAGASHYRSASKYLRARLRGAKAG